MRRTWILLTLAGLTLLGLAGYFLARPNTNQLSTDIGSHVQASQEPVEETSRATSGRTQSEATSTFTADSDGTSVPRTLADIAHTSSGIVEVEVTDVYLGVAVARVEKWIEALTLPGWSGEVPIVNQSYLNIYFPDNIASLIRPGGRYILFLQNFEDREWCVPLGYGIASGSQGIFEIQNAEINYAGLPQYSGMSMDLFEATLAQQISSAASQQPTVRPDTGQADLVGIVHSADVIVEASTTSSMGSTGGVFLGYSVDKVLKKPSSAALPSAIRDGKLSLRFIDCSNEPTEAGPRYILFLKGTGKLGEPNQIEGISFFGIDNFNLITRGGFTYPARGSLSLDSLNHYAGWPLSKVEAAISDALQAPYTPQPTSTNTSH